MDLRKRLVAPFANVSPNDELIVDLSSFVLRLLLFEKYIIQSIRLREFPHLIRAFGYEPVRELLSSGAVDIHCDAMTVGQVGQTGILESRRKKGLLPLGSYSFSSVKIADRKQYIHDCLQPLHNVEGLRNKEVKKIKRDIASRLLRLPSEVENNMMQQLKVDLQQNVPHIRTAIGIVLKEKLAMDIDLSDFSILINPIDEDDYHTESNIAELFSLGDDEAHKIVERGLLAIGGLNQRIAEMKAYTALSGFRDSDLPIFNEKLNFLADALAPEAQEARLRRIFAIKGFQDLNDLIARGKVDLIKLLEIREARECREFREWLFSIDSATDAEIEERINNMREKLSWFTHSKSGKTIKWLSSAGVGLIPGIGNVAGVLTSFLDTFLLEEVFPNPGPISFLNKLYPSIFKENP